ncbi:DUF2062 domain-containing protein [Thiohalorhabdus methylotrophus]|uniref:DUF2062 domain-containing protein n=1 Tax=Thiohalorhabdus methylotrophus TaxID=3242694 RepID=A0ABV4TTK0_9GAMM
MRNAIKKWLPTEHGLRRRMGERRAQRWLFARRGVWSLHRRALAGGIAAGLFIGLTPTVGLQTPLTLLAAIGLRVNFPLAFLALWISNPLTTPLLYWGFNRLGAHLLREHFPAELLTNLAPYLQVVIQQSTYLWLGSLILAIPAALLSYTGFMWAWRVHTMRRWRRRSVARQAV